MSEKKKDEEVWSVSTRTIGPLFEKPHPKDKKKPAKKR